MNEEKAKLLERIAYELEWTQEQAVEAAARADAVRRWAETSHEQAANAVKCVEKTRRLFEQLKAELETK